MRLHLTSHPYNEALCPASLFFSGTQLGTEMRKLLRVRCRNWCRRNCKAAAKVEGFLGGYPSCPFSCQTAPSASPPPTAGTMQYMYERHSQAQTEAVAELFQSGCYVAFSRSCLTLQWRLCTQSPEGGQTRNTKPCHRRRHDMRRAALSVVVRWVLVGLSRRLCQLYDMEQSSANLNLK